MSELLIPVCLSEMTMRPAGNKMCLGAKNLTANKHFKG